MVFKVLALLLAATFAATSHAATPPRMMVVADNRLAASAGLQILKAGGSAADAAIAAQAMLGLVEPQETGIGGGGVALYYDAKTHDITAYDGTPAAPASATADMRQPVQGGRAAGVPGMVPLLEALYRQHGHLPWSSLFQTAIDRAAEGFSVSAALARAVSADATHLARLPATKTYFLAHGPIRQGAILKNPDYADMLRRIATEGSAGLTHGQAAADIAAAIRADATRGLMTTDDLAAYNATTHAAVCAPYAHATLCTAPGGVPVLQALGMLAHVDMPQQNPGTALLLLDAGYLAAIDAATQNPLAPGFIDSRAAMLHAGRAVPRTAQTSAQPDQADSAVVIVDAKGNAISFVSSIGTAFGSHIMTHGFLLNDTLAEFSAAGPNGMEPGKRPASLMAPVIARDAAGHVATVLATASGTRMPALAVQTLLALLTWQLDPAQALALPHIIGTASTNELETSHDTATLAAVLRARGETIVIGKVNSASALIRIGLKGLSAAADPRHDGAALGD